MIAPIAFAFALAAAQPTVDDARFATAMIAAAVAESPRVDVITKEDLRQAMNLEADRQQVGCTDTSCLAEVAAAMGARLVIYGSLGTFDDTVALELSAFDGETASSLGRSVLQESSLKAVAAAAQGKARGLRDDALAKIGAEGRLRVLVMDFELRNATAGSAPTPAPAPGMGALGWGGVAAAGLGALALVVGIGADTMAVQTQAAADARDPETGRLLKTAAEARSDYETVGYATTTAVVGYVGAGVLGLVAVGLIAAEALSE